MKYDFFCYKLKQINVKIEQYQGIITHVLQGTRIISSEELNATRNLEADGCPSDGNVFEQSALLMNAMYIVFS